MMAEFQPVFPAHAIERCSITIAFGTEVPEKALKRIVDGSVSKVAELGLRQGAQPIGFQIDAATGKVSPLTGTGPVNFVSPDSQQQLDLLPNAIVWASQQYVRWAAFKAQFQKATSFALSQYEDIVSISSVRLEYWDRFIWNGGWEDFDISKLLKSESSLLAEKTTSVRRERHNHIGWFEDIADCRRLSNVNVDVVGLVLPTGVRPSVGIYTMLQDQVLQERGQQIFEAVPVAKRLDTLHSELKNMLRALIGTAMAERIGLNAGG